MAYLIYRPHSPVNPKEIEDLSRETGRLVSPDRVPEIRRQQAAEANVSAGLRGERGDAIGNVREEFRAGLEGKKPVTRKVKKK